MLHSDSYKPECWYKGVCDECAGEDKCVQYTKMRYMMSNSNIPVAKRAPITLYPSDVDIIAFERLAEIKNNIYDFVGEGKNLYITSEVVGNGKTSWSLKLLMKYFEEMLEEPLDIYGVFIHVPTFITKLKEFKSVDSNFEELKKLLLQVDLVVWDDIASTDMSGYDYTQLMMYIDNRNMSELSNIYTGNIANRDDMISTLGSRLTSRIWNSNTEVVQFFGGDRR